MKYFPDLFFRGAFLAETLLSPFFGWIANHMRLRGLGSRRSQGFIFTFVCYSTICQKNYTTPVLFFSFAVSPRELRGVECGVDLTPKSTSLHKASSERSHSSVERKHSDGEQPRWPEKRTTCIPASVDRRQSAGFRCDWLTGDMHTKRPLPAQAPPAGLVLVPAPKRPHVDAAAGGGGGVASPRGKRQLRSGMLVLFFVAQVYGLDPFAFGLISLWAPIWTPVQWKVSRGIGSWQYQIVFDHWI